MKDGKCSIKNCRNHSCMNVLGNELCDIHWGEYCDWSENGGKTFKEYLEMKNGKI